ncbi:hypothetical protein [uncultured Gilliamella sp.]|uniref:hypothetical protein n=1 Tax=uncultured Gilliamella sp. TaxID=1193505 RepID=UPI0025E774E1|nr:hypothetical protein [uncultured Gilliamella sp.]
MENRTFEFRCFTRRSFKNLMILTLCFGFLVVCCLTYLFVIFFDAIMPMIPNQYFEVIYIIGMLVPALFSIFLFAISIVSFFRKKMTINANSYSINIDDHKKLNQMFQWSALQKVIRLKVENTVWVNQTLILEFDNKRIKMLTVKGKIALLSKKDIDQFFEFTQYLHEQVLKPDFTLISVDQTLSSKTAEFLVNAPHDLENRYLYVRN